MTKEREETNGQKERKKRRRDSVCRRSLLSHETARKWGLL
jgi:hypothetical protein